MPRVTQHHRMDGPSPGLLFCSRSAHMEENQRSTDMATGRRKAIRLRWEKMRRWTSPRGRRGRPCSLRTTTRGGRRQQRGEMGAAACLGHAAERPLGARPRAPLGAAAPPPRRRSKVEREQPLGLFHGGRRGSGQRRKVSFFLFDGDWLWRAMGFTSAKTPATLLR